MSFNFIRPRKEPGSLIIRVSKKNWYYTKPHWTERWRHLKDLVASGQTDIYLQEKYRRQVRQWVILNLKMNGDTGRHVLASKVWSIVDFLNPVTDVMMHLFIDSKTPLALQQKLYVRLGYHYHEPPCSWLHEATKQFGLHLDPYRGCSALGMPFDKLDKPIRELILTQGPNLTTGYVHCMYMESKMWKYPAYRVERRRITIPALDSNLRDSVYMLILGSQLTEALDELVLTSSS